MEPNAPRTSGGERLPRAVVGQGERREQQAILVLDLLELHAEVTRRDPHDAARRADLVAGHVDRELHGPIPRLALAYHRPR